MTEARFDIEIQDKVAKSIRTELQGIASAAKDGYGSVKTLKTELAGLSAAMSATASQTARAEQATSRAALAQQKLATETARTALATERAALAAQRSSDITERAKERNENASIRAAVAAERSSQREAAAAQRSSDKQESAARSAQAAIEQKAERAAAAMSREAAAADALTAKYQAQARAARFQSNIGAASGIGGGSGKSAAESAVAFMSQDPTKNMVKAEKAALKVEEAVAKVGAASVLSRQHAMNLGFQLNDVFVSLASGQKPLTVFVQQGAQIGQIASQSGLGLAGMTRAAFGLIAPFLPLVAIIGAATAGFAYLNHEVNKDSGLKEYSKTLGLTAKDMKELKDVTVTMGDTSKAIFQVTGAAIWEHIGGGVKKTGKAFGEFFDEVMLTTKQEANLLIGGFVGAYRAILATWRMWPGAIGDIFVSGVNLAIRSINDLNRTAVASINAFLIGASAFNPGLRAFMLTAQDIAEVKNSNAGAAQELGTAWKAEMDGAMNTDYVGAAFNAVRDQAIKNAQKRLRDQADKLRDDPKKPSSAKTDAEKRADEMAKLNNELDSQILLLGFYGQALERESKFQTINNALLAKKITLTTGEEASIRNRLLLIQDGLRVQEALNRIEEEASGPQRDYKASTDAITIALRDNIITEAEATRQRNLARTALVDGLDPLKAYNDNIRQSTELAALYGRELAIQTRAQELFNQAVAAGRDTADGNRSNYVGTARDEAKQADYTSAFAGIDKKEQQDPTAFLLDNAKALYENIAALRAQDLIDEETAAERKKNLDVALSDARLSTMSGMFGQLASLQSSSNREMAALGKAAAIAQATIDGYRAVQAALAGPPGPPWSFAIAGVTAAMTAVNVAKIAGVGFMSGGYTGNMGTSQVAGAVHGQEYVFDAQATKRIGVPALEAMRNGSTLGRGPANDNGGGRGVTVIAEAGTYVEERATSDGHIELIARRVARQEAPKAVADDIRKSPNSPTSKAVSQSFSVKRVL